MIFSNRKKDEDGEFWFLDTGLRQTVELDLPGIRIIDQRRPDQPAFVLPDRDHLQG